MSKSGEIASGLIGGGQELGGAIGEGMQAVGYGINSYNDFTGGSVASGIEDAAQAGYDCIKTWEDAESGHYFGQ